MGRMGPKPKPVKERFDRHWKICEGGCWIWTGGRISSGYGQFRVGNKHVTAHRASYEIHVGRIPSGMYVLHGCDVKLCVNPEHLRTGTVLDNSADAVARDRIPRGVRHGMSRLSESDVLRIRKRVALGEQQKLIAEELEVSRSLICQIVLRKKWTHI